MSVRTISTLVLTLALLIVAAPMAGAAKGAKGEKGPFERIIKHASELKLTTDQVSKLQALEAEEHTKGKGKGKDLREKVKAILTAEQIELIKKFKEEHKKTK